VLLVRLAALLELACYRDDNFLECVELGINDGNEMTQRFAFKLAADCGNDRFVEPMVALYCENYIPDRVRFDLGSGFRSFDSAIVVNAFDKVFPKMVNYADPANTGNTIRKNLISLTSYLGPEFARYVLSDENTEKSRISEIHSIRNYPAHSSVPQLLKYLSEPKEPAIQEAMWEALGWFELSYQAPLIAAKAKEVMDDTRYPEPVRKQALRAYNRLK
jgi:hypothetical protein